MLLLLLSFYCTTLGCFMYYARLNLSILFSFIVLVCCYIVLFPFTIFNHFITYSLDVIESKCIEIHNISFNFFAVMCLWCSRSYQRKSSCINGIELHVLCFFPFFNMSVVHYFYCRFRIVCIFILSLFSNAHFYS